MADTRIKDLPLAESITDNDFFVFDGSNSGTNKISKATLLGDIESNITDIENVIGDTVLPTTAQTITGAIAEHEEDISGINTKLTTFKFKEYTANYTCPSAGQVQISGNNFSVSTPAGYTPLALVRIATGDNSMVVRNVNVASTGSQNVVSIYNAKSSSVSATCTIGIVYVSSNSVI